MPSSVFYLLIPLLSFTLTAFFLKRFIRVLSRKKIGQPILEIGPSWHKAKEGTPTMGGVVFFLSLPLFSLLGAYAFQKEVPRELCFLLIYALLNGLCGIVDDAAKLKRKENQGLLPWQKLLWQAGAAAIFLWLYQSNGGDIPPFHLPFSSLTTEMGILNNLLLMLLLVGMVNFVNLTDGIDGLVGSSAFITGVFFMTEGILGVAPLLPLGLALIGSMMGFLLYNKHPARVFMGDTGSLFLGALTAGGAFLLGKPAAASVYGIVYVLEGLSVVLQVLFYKKTKKRLFLMAPFHHHLEKKGWREERIVYLFILLSTIASVAAHFA